ncbi:phage portal protein [Staphylococcus delphini]|uniref:phage portal protein n=1 Tax=Staphylococcus delphini TaxID=53344 RepID=UPI0021D1898E|nr:phage portal protein [Staphylococcus delphini]UXS43750.1 phage portal protein [Staphylococcus delphini]UXV46283.1 phage portal protein [Staphylococcus delphini]
MITIYWPNEKPYHERVIEMIKPKHETQEEMILRLIQNHKENIENITVGERYYNHHPDILDLPFKRDVKGNYDPLKPDWRMYTNYHQNLVDQKVAYAVGNPITFGTDDEKSLKKIQEVLNHKWDDKLVDILTAASNKGVEWLQPYIDEQGEFKTFRVPAEQAIPIWTNKERDELKAFIRLYELDGGERVEYWTDTEVTFYELQHGQLIPDYYHGDDNIQAHYYVGDKKMSWNRVPFIPFKNNPQEVSDLFMYKTVIDAMDKRLSDTQNTFDESTELIYILKGYEGQNLDEFMQNLKYYKAINVDGDGSGVDTIQIEVPVQSSKEYLDMLRDYVIEFGQGVDFQQDKFGNSPSGIALKFMYSNLDLKANKLKNKTLTALQELLHYIIDFYKLNIDVHDIEISFNFNVMVNELEQSQIGVQSQYLSKETVITNHPWVDDPVAEMERIEQDNIEFNNQLPSLEGDSNAGTQNNQSE